MGLMDQEAFDRSEQKARDADASETRNGVDDDDEHDGAAEGQQGNLPVAVLFGRQATGWLSVTIVYVGLICVFFFFFTFGNTRYSGVFVFCFAAAFR